jgi:hypothetical protein
VANNLRQTLATSANDDEFHTMATGGMDDTGRWIYIFAAGLTPPPTESNLTSTSERRSILSTRTAH